MKTMPAAALALVFAGAMSVAGSAGAQPMREAKSLLLDHSSEALIDAATAKAVLRENVPAKVWKLYPEGKWTFLSQVEGGVTAAGTCVITARVVLLPRTGTVRAVLWRPEKTATAFDALPNTGAEPCKAAAKAKLKEATQAVVSTLIKS